jgi:hypothetical protein
MAEFVVGLRPELASAWADRTLADEGNETVRLKANALRIRERMAPTKSRSTPFEPGRVTLSGQDLRQEDLAGVDLRGADLRLSNLADQKLSKRKSNFSGARLDGAILTRADLTNAILVNASLEQADLSEAQLLGVDLRGASLKGSVWRRTKLIGALFDDGALAGLDTYGAALPNATEASPVSTPSSSDCLFVAWSPDGKLVASAHDSILRLWEAGSGRELRQFTGHQDNVEPSARTGAG